MNNKMLKFVGTVVAAITVLGASAMAGTSYEGFNTTVAKHNGSGYTGSQTKELNGNNAVVKMESVGGNYAVDAQLQEYNGDKWVGTGDWAQNLDDNTKREITATGDMKKGDKVRIEFSNWVITPVNVQVIGEWKSN